MSGSAKPLVLTVDVEDWFQVENLRPVFPSSTWDSQEYRVEANVERLLESFAEHEATATFFVLGCIAERFPQIVRTITRQGHELASHGYGHILLSSLSRVQIEEDLRSSKALLEEIAGQEVRGYRAPSFSISDAVYPILKKLGYSYDSSVNPFVLHDRYGTVTLEDFSITDDGWEHRTGIVEYPIPMLELGRARIPWGGGAYFRLIPARLFMQGMDYFFKTHSAFVLYLHPWEIDWSQPRVTSVSLTSRFRHYYGLKYTLRKLERILSTYPSISFAELSAASS
jgi:polysaccharide deacetylase family protein (PEP-CTERM system associated)